MIPRPGLFYWRNKGRSLPLFVLVALSVAVIGVVATLTGSILQSIYAVDVAPLEQFSLLVSKDLRISPAILKELAEDSEIELSVPFLDSSIRALGLLGSEKRHIFALDGSALTAVLAKLDLRLSAGELPRPGTNDLLLHESIIKSKSLRLGDLVGQEVDPEEYLWGLFRVCGALSGPVPLGFASLDFFKQQWMFDLGSDFYALMLFPKGEIAALNKSLSQYPGDKVTIRALEQALSTYKEESLNMDLLLGAVNLAIISIISLSMGLLNTIHFLGRMKEFGVLLMIGLSPLTLILRTFAEVLILALVGFAGGTLLAWLLTWGVSAKLFAPRGIEVGLVSWRYLAFTLPIPLFLAVFSFLTIAWNTRRLDVIAITEGREL